MTDIPLACMHTCMAYSNSDWIPAGEVYYHHETAVVFAPDGTHLGVHLMTDGLFWCAGLVGPDLEKLIDRIYAKWDAPSEPTERKVRASGTLFRRATVNRRGFFRAAAAGASALWLPDVARVYSFPTPGWIEVPDDGLAYAWKRDGDAIVDAVPDRTTLCPPLGMTFDEYVVWFENALLNAMAKACQLPRRILEGPPSSTLVTMLAQAEAQTMVNASRIFLGVEVQITLAGNVE